MKYLFIILIAVVTTLGKKRQHQDWNRQFRKYKLDEIDRAGLL